MKNYSYIITIIMGFLLTIASSFSAKLSLQPSGGVLIKDCPNPIQIILDTEGETTNTVDVKIIDNPSFTLHGISDSGAIFGSYTKSLHAKIRHGQYKGKNAIYLLGTNPGIGKFNGTGVFSTLNIIPHPEISSGKVFLNLYILPHQNSDDSNVSIIQGEKIIDTLNIAIGSEYTIISGTCPLINSGSLSIQNPKYYIDHLDKLEEKNMLLTQDNQERIKIPTKLIKNPKRKFILKNIRDFIKKIFTF